MMKRYLDSMDRGHPARYGQPGKPRSGAGFTLVEVLFAIAILGVGIVGILTLFVSGINMAGWAGSRSQASMEAQSLYAQILSYVHPAPVAPHVANTRNYVEVMRDKFYPTTAGVPKWAGGGTPGTPISIWIQAYNFGTATDKSGDAYKNPVPISLGHDYYWQCRVTNYMMDKKDPIGTATPATADINPPGLVEVALAIHKQWKPGKEALAVYTTLLSLESK